MSTPYFSIVIPTLNEEHYLPRLLTDLQNQKDKDFEVIIIDGKSEDKTVQLAKSFQKDIDLHIHLAEKRNLSYQRNLGGDNAKGLYIIFIDADCEVDTNFIQNLKISVQKDKYLVFLPALFPQGNSLVYGFFFKIHNFFIQLSQNLDKPMPSTSVMIFHKKFFDFLQGYIEKKQHDKNIYFPEDHEILCRAKKYGVKAKYLTNVRVLFSMRRFEKQSKIKVMSTYLLSTIMMTFKGDMGETKIQYEMGGHLYSK
jgi:glycosyltransferase involved in cell wall biosynthesis